MNLTRPRFDAACASLAGTPHAMHPDQCAALWRALVPAPAPRHVGRPRWTPAATAFRTPLLREINTVHAQHVRGQFKGQWLHAPDKLPVDIGQLHCIYASRLNDILLRIDTALRAHGHWCTKDLDAEAQPMRIVVTNERAALRHAGERNWTQWEDPNVARRFSKVFAAYAASLPTIRGAQWQPYMPDGARKRGAAFLLKQQREWRSAFHDAIHAPPDYDPSDSVYLLAFHEKLRSKPMQQVIEDAILAQCDVRKGPTNPAFKLSVWHALPVDVRVNLAHEFNSALVATRAELEAQGQPLTAYLSSPETVFNPFALREGEAIQTGSAQ